LLLKNKIHVTKVSDHRHHLSALLNPNLRINDTIMEDLKIQFTHPVKGKIQLRNKLTKNKVKMLNFSSDKDFSVAINLNHLSDGNWTASLEWEHNNQLFLLKRNFKIVDNLFIQ